MRAKAFILVLGLTMSACSQGSDSAAPDLIEVTPKSLSSVDLANLCTTPAQVICSGAESELTKSIRKDGFQLALADLKKEFSLNENFDGSTEAFKMAFSDSPQKRFLAQDRLLVLSDKRYREAYNYDADLLEASQLAKSILIQIISDENLDPQNRYGLVQALNRTTVQTISMIFETDYPGKDIQKIDVKAACEVNGLGSNARSAVLPGSREGVVFVCPGKMIKEAGKSKEDRITALVSLLGHELSHQLQFAGLAEDRIALSCLSNAKEYSSIKDQFNRNHNQETLADIFGFKVLNSYLAKETDNAKKLNKALLAINWMCDVNDVNSTKDSRYLDKEIRMKNFFMLKESDAIHSCSESPRC